MCHFVFFFFCQLFSGIGLQRQDCQPLSTRESSLETQHLGFLLDTGHCLLAASAWHVPNFQNPRRKAGVWHKPCCLYSQGTVSHSHLLIAGTLLKSKFPGAMAASQTAFQRTAVSPTKSIPFYTAPFSFLELSIHKFCLFFY